VSWAFTPFGPETSEMRKLEGPLGQNIETVWEGTTSDMMVVEPKEQSIRIIEPENTVKVKS
jgi:hypothetical protein